MRILITGGAGFIGSHTADALIAQGHDVRLLDNLQQPVHRKGKPTYLHPQAEFIFGDVRDRRVVEQKLPIRRVVVASSQAVLGEGLYECGEHGRAETRSRLRLILGRSAGRSKGNASTVLTCRRVQVNRVFA